eukprot:gene5649-biopygen2315
MSRGYSRLEPNTREQLCAGSVASFQAIHMWVEPRQHGASAAILSLASRTGSVATSISYGIILDSMSWKYVFFLAACCANDRTDVATVVMTFVWD